MTVDAYEAADILARLLDEVAVGRTVSITRHGREIAHLVPPSRRASADDVIAELHAARRGVRLDQSAVREMISEGRR